MRKSTISRIRLNLMFMGFLPAVLVLPAFGSIAVRAASLSRQSGMAAAAIPEAATKTAKSADTGPGQAISASVLEKDYGLQILHIAVTAAGGMVDFRFKILDPEKAGPLFKDHDQMPVLMVDDGGVTIKAPHNMVNVRMKKDAVGFILYPNVHSAVKTGKLVSPVFGKLRVEPVKVQ